MRLVDLAPRWLLKDGCRVGFIFKSPANANYYQSCMFAPTPMREQYGLFADELRLDNEQREDGAYSVQGCKPECSWAVTPSAEQAEFASLTVHPSIDGSPGGLWHGFIKNGEIT